MRFRVIVVVCVAIASTILVYTRIAEDDIGDIRAPSVKHNVSSALGVGAQGPAKQELEVSTEGAHGRSRAHGSTEGLAAHKELNDDKTAKLDDVKQERAKLREERAIKLREDNVRLRDGETKTAQTVKASKKSKRGQVREDMKMKLESVRWRKKSEMPKDSEDEKMPQISDRAEDEKMPKDSEDEKMPKDSEDENEPIDSPGSVENNLGGGSVAADSPDSVESNLGGGSVAADSADSVDSNSGGESFAAGSSDSSLGGDSDAGDEGGDDEDDEKKGQNRPNVVHNELLILGTDRTASPALDKYRTQPLYPAGPAQPDTKHVHFHGTKGPFTILGYKGTGIAFFNDILITMGQNMHKDVYEITDKMGSNGTEDCFQKKLGFNETSGDAPCTLVDTRRADAIFLIRARSHANWQLPSAGPIIHMVRDPVFMILSLVRHDRVVQSKSNLQPLDCAGELNRDLCSLSSQKGDSSKNHQVSINSLIRSVGGPLATDVEALLSRGFMATMLENLYRTSALPRALHISTEHLLQDPMVVIDCIRGFGKVKWFDDGDIKLALWTVFLKGAKGRTEIIARTKRSLTSLSAVVERQLQRRLRAHPAWGPQLTALYDFLRHIFIWQWKANPDCFVPAVYNFTEPVKSFTEMRKNRLPIKSRRKAAGTAKAAHD